MNEGYVLLRWLDQHPYSHPWLAGGIVLLSLGLAVIPFVRGSPDAQRRHDWFWAGLILAILTAGRWPSLLVSREFNPDESRHLAGAHALLHDPVFWRSVDGATSGPLNYFALCPAGLLGGWDTYLPARLTALLLLGLALTLMHQAMALQFGRSVARLAGLSAVCFEAFTHSIELLHYSTELLSLTLIAAAIYAAARRWLVAGGPLWSGLGGLLLGAVPFAKLQAAPLAACLGAGWLVAEFCSTNAEAGRRRLYLLGGALLPTFLFAWQLTIAGLWGDFFFAYFQSNIHYTSVGQSSLGRLLADTFAKSAQEDGLLHFWLPGNLLFCALMFRLRSQSRRAVWAGIACGFVACLLTAIVILSPGRTFLHYWHFMILPGLFLPAVLLGNLIATSPPTGIKRDRWLAVSCVVALVGMLLVHRARSPSPFMGSLVFFRQHPRTELAEHVMAAAPAGGPIAIWGWSSYVYVEGGLWPAAREADFVQVIASGPHRQKYRERFLTDLMRVRPPLFLDSTGRASLIYQSPELAHDRIFPELATMVRANYVLVDEVDGARIYRRRDLPGR